ncbi:hypothetical protein BZA77DRAFT_321216 [Pyronema omphalodes]|nr:hypothetical protein BZA77DRAFT_321216 [Pyronema omphalodes]
MRYSFFVHHLILTGSCQALASFVIESTLHTHRHRWRVASILHTSSTMVSAWYLKTVPIYFFIFMYHRYIDTKV